MKKYKNFELNWKVNNYDDFIAALSLFDNWALNGAVNGEEFKVKVLKTFYVISSIKERIM